MAEKKPIIVNGGNGGSTTVIPEKPVTETRPGAGYRAPLSLRVRGSERLPAAPRSVQDDPGRPDVPLQLRPAARARDGTLEIALADPRNLNLIDELSLLLDKKLRVKVATLSQISDLLKKTEQSQRVLEEVTEGFTLDVVRDDETRATRRSPSTS